MEEYTISEDCRLPSKGLVYNTKINPLMKVRSMTTDEDMKRLGHSDRRYKIMSEIIDACIIEKPKDFSSYDLCVADFQYLLHRVRVASFGTSYKIECTCPICGKKFVDDINLDELEIKEFEEELNKYLTITLPKTKKQLELRLQTPRILDDTADKARTYCEKYPDVSLESASLLFTLCSVIKTIDGVAYDEIELRQFIKELPIGDENYILQCLDKLNVVGVNMTRKVTCKNASCKYEYEYAIPFTREFFRPSID